VDSVVTFRVGDERYALPADVVAECVEVGPITDTVPTTAGGRLGLASVRGHWVPVVELADTVEGAARLDSSAASSVLLVLGRDRGYLGLRVEGFDGVFALDRRVGPGRRGDAVIELDGELVRFIDPGVLLASRAELLGKEGAQMEEHQAAAEPIQVVAFRVGGEEFGVDVMRVQRVLKKPDIRVIPNAPAFVEGVVAVRDSIVPVIDMRKRFSVPDKPTHSAGALLVVAAGDGQVALVVDEVPGVAKLQRDSVSPAPEIFKGLAGKYLEGIAEDQGRLLILLNLDEILTSKERIALNKMLKTAGDETDKPKKPGGKPKKKSGGRAKKKAKE
jgi:purine-binding chemotaxis protein CheW